MKTIQRPNSTRLTSAVLVAITLLGAAALRASDALREKLLSATEVPRGLVVLLGGETVTDIAGLCHDTDYQVYTQFADESTVRGAREALRAAGLLGTRAFVGEGPSDRLVLASGLADVVVVQGESRMPVAETMRVLRPGGRAWLGGSAAVVKPFPAGADDWSHPYHRGDNNPLSRDKLIRAPYLTQFLADPRYAPLPQVAVAAHGRVFKAFGHIAFKEREEPLLNTLAAFNGHNGTLLWKRSIPPALMVHRNTLIASADRLYFGDDRSCKVYEAATGELLDEIRPPEDLVDGTFWKWMALEDGVLYALVGEQEQRDPTITLRWDKHGWPWNPLSPGFNQPEHAWGFGRTLVALDPGTKRVLWSHREERPIDSRALCLGDGRLFAFRFGEYLVCLDAKTGQELWRRTPENASALFAAFGKYLDRQDWRTNWRTTAYARCTDRAVYFAGPSIGRLIAVDASNGELLWDHPSDNYQLIVRPDAVYGLSGQIDSDVSRIFEPLTGEVLAELKLGRRACTRPTGCEDAIFFRASGGSVRLDISNNQAGLVSPMRAQCQDGVTIANGLLYWWPSSCDCNLSLYGITALGSAGDFDFTPSYDEAGRLTRAANTAVEAALSTDSRDWPFYRADSRATARTQATLPANVSSRWRLQLGSGIRPTAPTTAGGLVFFGASDGSVQAVDARSGKVEWRVITGGALRYPPTIAGGRAYVGSGDGSVYCLEAKTGRELWRYRVAPADRFIPVYGGLMSTWPVGSGVLVENGVAYAAAGIVNYDGTHVVALDAANGALKWHNGTSGHLDPEARSGVSVQGHLLMVGDRLNLAGGNAVSPAVYDATTGRCLNDPGLLRQTVNNNVPASLSPRGSELYLVEGEVFVSDKPHYAHPRHPVLDDLVLRHTLVTPLENRDLLWVNNSELLCYDRIGANRAARLHGAWGKPQIANARPLWRARAPESRALAVGRNAAVLALPDALVAVALDDGRELWRHSLPEWSVPWGLALDRDGTVVVSLENGEVLGFGGTAALAGR